MHFILWLFCRIKLFVTENGDGLIISCFRVAPRYPIRHCELPRHLSHLCLGFAVTPLVSKVVSAVSLENTIVLSAARGRTVSFQDVITALVCVHWHTRDTNITSNRNPQVMRVEYGRSGRSYLRPEHGKTYLSSYHPRPNTASPLKGACR